MFTSSWSNPQQNQQQPQQTSAFGQPPAFGSTTNNAFGSTSAFGQPQQQQQPAVNPMFGNISSTPSTNAGTTGGFGAFGGTTNNASTSAFGAKPAGAFGAFGGGTGAFGGGTTSAFGQPANNAATTTSVFGQPAATNTTSAFGGATGGGLFGGKSAFGTSSLAGATGTTIPVVTSGTSNPPYNVTNEKDGTVTLQFQSISCMPAYIGYSFEELRLQDYLQNRKTASTTGAFATSAFGAAQPATNNVFGTQPAQQPTTSLFGGATNPTTTTTNAFGGGFGQTNTQPAAPTNPLFGGAAFGQTQQQPQQQQNAFGSTGAFGTQQPQPQTGLFGSTNNTSAFGTTAPKPAFGTFGNTAAAPSVFGAGTNTFGNTQQQTQQPPQSTSIFGTAPASNTSAFGNFGNTAAKPSIFGTTPAAQPAATNPFGTGTFGSTQQPQQQQQTSLFGNTTGNSLFGNAQNQQNQQQQQGAQQTSLFGGGQQANPTPSLFGNTGNTGTGLFGNTQANQQQQQQNQQQATNGFGGLFGGGIKPPQPAAPLFGNQQQQQQPQQQQTSLFGNNGFGQSTQNNSLFGNKQAAPLLTNSLSGGMGMMNTSLFGGSVNNGGVQGTLTASIAQPIGENLPIFDMLPPGPRIVDLEVPKKKAGFFVDMPTRSPVPRVQLGFTPANSKLRGFGSSTSLMSSTAGLNGTSFTTGKPGALALNKSDARASSIGPDFLGRSGSPALGSGGRQSVKKVILDKKVEPGELFVKSGSPGGLKTGKVTFSPALSVASREKDAQLLAAASQVLESPSPVARTQQRTPSGFGSKNTKPAAITDTDDSSSTELGDGDYWVKPDMQTLKRAGYDQLSSFEGLVVGRKGYGEIHFLEPVDLTGLPKLGALLGDVVRFDDKECSVYPDSDDADKPPPGSGLNVKAQLRLEKCWAVDKASREPITDANHPNAVKHLKRLKNMKDTHFDNFDMKTGTWTFTVDHF